MKRIDRTHTIEIPLPVEIAFPLFTPRGEMDWINEWKPEFIHPADGETCEGMVFTTGTGAEETFWSCIEWAPDAHRVRYIRVTPASRFAHVTVQCEPFGSGSTRVHVRYEITALTPSGKAILAKTTSEAFRASIESWKAQISRWIASRSGSGAPPCIAGAASVSPRD